MSNKSEKRPTLRTIAEQSGFAVATVSRALSNAPDIGAETKKVVRRIANEIGYTPNRAGLLLRTGKTRVISIVMDVSPQGADHSGLFIGAIANALAGLSYQLNITPIASDGDIMDSVRQVADSQAADAIILDRTQDADPRVAFLMERGIPFATYGRTQWSDKHPYFDYDNAVFARRCVQHLARARATRILMITPPKSLFCARAMIAAGQSEAIRLGVDLELLDKVNDLKSRDEVQSAVQKRMTSADAPDAIIATSAPTAIAAVLGVERAGLTVSEDVQVIAKETAPILQTFRPKMTVVQEDVVAAGTFLARAAVRAVEVPEDAPLQHLALHTEFKD